MENFKEPIQEFGGSWTEDKLRCFENYVNAYLIIMKSTKDKYRGWPKTIYFDGFAGSGINIKSSQLGYDLFFNNVETEELSVYKGSAERVLSLPIKFDEYYFVDIVSDNISTLKKYLVDKGFDISNCHFKIGDVNEELKYFSSKLTQQEAVLILLDPFGMDIHWDSIETLKNKRIDLWILVPSGMVINRLLDRKGNIIYSKKLESYFGLQFEEIKNIFYEKQQVETLFEQKETIQKINKPIEKIAEIYINRLKNIFKFVTEKPLVLLNSKNVPIYHFIFASNNNTAFKIASYIIEKRQK